MSRVIVTFGVGEIFSQMLETTGPRMREYAKYHCVHFIDNSGPSGSDSTRPYSWAKVPLIKHLLTMGYDEVLWLDADVWIRDLRFNIFEELHKDSWHGMVLHRVPGDSYVPNCGVWVLRKPMLPYLETMWGMTQYINHCNWEQAALINLMGGNPDNIARVPMPHWNVSRGIEFHTSWLDYRWNQHPRDVRRFDPAGYFWHCTMFEDRLKTLRGWANG